MTREGTISTEDLKQLSVPAILELFAALPAPTIGEMDGEYEASILRQSSRLMERLGQIALYNGLIGHWRCKAFRPLQTDLGRGYNSFLHRGAIVQRYPMQTLIAPSRYDGRPAYTLVYRAFHSLCGGLHMVDEVRRLDAQRFLGIGTYGFSEWQRRIPLPFLLSGPVAEYRGDIGRERSGFAAQTELLAPA